MFQHSHRAEEEPGQAPCRPKVRRFAGSRDAGALNMAQPARGLAPMQQFSYLSRRHPWPKPLGFSGARQACCLTSHACGGPVRRAMGSRRVGHGGTVEFRPAPGC